MKYYENMEPSDEKKLVFLSIPNPVLHPTAMRDYDYVLRRASQDCLKRGYTPVQDAIQIREDYETWFDYGYWIRHRENLIDRCDIILVPKEGRMIEHCVCERLHASGEEKEFWYVEY